MEASMLRIQRPNGNACKIREGNSSCGERKRAGQFGKIIEDQIIVSCLGETIIFKLVEFSDGKRYAYGVGALEESSGA